MIRGYLVGRTPEGGGMFYRIRKIVIPFCLCYPQSLVWHHRF
jgi:hypothetical protein